jgi:hypothetical protein
LACAVERDCISERTRAALMASFVKLLLDQAEQQAKFRESGKKDEAVN